MTRKLTAHLLLVTLGFLAISSPISSRTMERQACTTTLTASQRRRQ